MALQGPFAVASYMVCMTRMTHAEIARLNDARDTDGRFGEQARTAPEMSLRSPDPGFGAGVKHVSTREEGTGWPTQVTTVNEVTGTLKKRVQGRLGANRGRVFLQEYVWEGGHSEWTSESGQEFTVSLGDQSVTFYPEYEVDSWVDGAAAPPAGRDSVYARFDRWLQAAERPEEMFAEHFDQHDGRITLRPDSALFGDALKGWNTTRFHVKEILLRPEPQEGYVFWRLAALGPDTGDFRPFLKHQVVANTDTATPDARALMLGVTSAVCPGRERGSA